MIGNILANANGMARSDSGLYSGARPDEELYRLTGFLHCRLISDDNTDLHFSTEFR